jgi:hypothetical protein
MMILQKPLENVFMKQKKK